MSLPFNVNSAMRKLKRSDAALAALIEQVGPYQLNLRKNDNTFHALAHSIVYQQLSGKAAGTIFGRVVKLYPGARKLTPERIASTPDSKLRGAGLSRNKLAALRDLTDKCNDGTVPGMSTLKNWDDERIVQQLTQVRGIGRWTVEMLLMFRLGRPDVFPLEDLGIQKGFRRTFGDSSPSEKPNKPAMQNRAELWRPYRSVASWYLWRAADA